MHQDVPRGGGGGGNGTTGVNGSRIRVSAKVKGQKILSSPCLHKILYNVSLWSETIQEILFINCSPFIEPKMGFD